MVSAHGGSGSAIVAATWGILVSLALLGSLTRTTESVLLARLATYTSRADGSPESLMPLNGEATATPTGSWPTGIVTRACRVSASRAVRELPVALATNNE